MPKPKPGARITNSGDTPKKILALLDEYGPMTVLEICRELEKTRANISNCITRLKQPTKRPKGPKRIYIWDWKSSDDFGREYLRPVYALGAKRDKPKPNPVDGKERQRRYRHHTLRHYALRRLHFLGSTSAIDCTKVEESS